MTIPCTQVTCERVFSKLNIVKNKLRNSMSQELLSPLILMNCEKDLFESMDKNNIIDEIASTTQELRQKLII